ncbi:hypothetical protein DC31_06445 [Microbacterium sp. CH12i]|uniref:ATP-binding protein n=1 Tax=Microbacterium sp. CH12i TaxID=1479651 RepID=UPI000460A5F3|nr:ATP-binding protein [Microbacterium sp. CH12i]KDA04537.1 hypothetical protein DC31_06445 [Microbacterium sp. CH12i]
MDADPVSTTQARTAWHVGVDPLLTAFPTHAGDILRAIAFAHRAHFPVPVFITGRTGAGKTTLARVIGDLTGQVEPFELPQLSLLSIRKAARAGEPLIVDDAAPAGAHARPSMFTQIQGEIYSSRNSPLHAASIIVATGEQKIDELSQGRVLLARINRRRAPIEIYQQLHDAAAAASRRSVHTYLQAQIPHISLSNADNAAARIALSDHLDHGRRRDAALHIGHVLLRNLDLNVESPRPHLSADDQIITATHAALLYALDNGATLTGSTDWTIGRRDDDYLYVIPGEIITFIRAESGNPDLSTTAVAAALERNHMLYPSRTQGRSIPRSINGTLTRVWRLTPGLIA